MNIFISTQILRFFDSLEPKSFKGFQEEAVTGGEECCLSLGPE